MSINIEDLSPNEAARLLAQLSEQARIESTEQRTNEEIDRTLQASLAERGVGVGCQWEDPEGRASRTYPKGWVVQHCDHWWIATEHAVLSEPSEGNPEWGLNDPEPAPETVVTDSVEDA